MALALFENDAKPGDLIQIFRGTYQHWAIYIGGNEVIHLTTPNDESNSFVNMLMLVDSTKAQVRRQKIWEVVDGDRFKVNNLLDDKYEPRDRRAIVRKACRLENLELEYNIFTQNCEHFVTNLRYGKPESRQVRRAVEIGGAVLLGVGIVALSATLLASLLKDDDEDERRHEHRSQRRYIRRQ
ncbi:phospholipase A and acyltransferase 4-like [Clinocottus analis]|uniref:phospholipase A and acyltransferase 4-like n=1 Tax=Clinocottus analis TaxID=304258 RepID=UPI0035C233E0